MQLEKVWKIDVNGHEVLCSIVERTSGPMTWNCGYCYLPFTFENVEDIEVHGGVTFHEKGEGNETIIGFDTAHGVGRMESTQPLEWMIEQTESMAKQAIQEMLKLNP